jgi:hypothetical protein
LNDEKAGVSSGLELFKVDDVILVEDVGIKGKIALMIDFKSPLFSSLHLYGKS